MLWGPHRGSWGHQSSCSSEGFTFRHWVPRLPACVWKTLQHCFYSCSPDHCLFSFWGPPDPGRYWCWVIRPSLGTCWNSGSKKRIESTWMGKLLPAEDSRDLPWVRRDCVLNKTAKFQLNTCPGLVPALSLRWPACLEALPKFHSLHHQQSTLHPVKTCLCHSPLAAPFMVLGVELGPPEIHMLKS